MCSNSEAQLLGSVCLGLFSQQGAHSAPQDEGDAAAGHRSVRWRLSGFGMTGQLHQQRQEGGKIGLQPGAPQGGDENHVGLPGEREDWNESLGETVETSVAINDDTSSSRQTPCLTSPHEPRSFHHSFKTNKPVGSLVLVAGYLCDSDSDVLPNRTGAL